MYIRSQTFDNFYIFKKNACNEISYQCLKDFERDSLCQDMNTIRRSIELQLF